MKTFFFPLNKHFSLIKPPRPLSWISLRLKLRENAINLMPHISSFSVFLKTCRCQQLVGACSCQCGFRARKFLFSQKKVENRDRVEISHHRSSELSIVLWRITWINDNYMSTIIKMLAKKFTSDEHLANHLARVIWLGTIVFTFTQNGKSHDMKMAKQKMFIVMHTKCEAGSIAKPSWTTKETQLITWLTVVKKSCNLAVNIPRLFIVPSKREREKDI